MAVLASRRLHVHGLAAASALVCSNCHRILHRSRPMLSVEQLRGRLIN
jgi:predicted HNH restriction endonuclease